jgi:pyruvate ferredoxin oxidoreductase beta subunit
MGAATTTTPAGSVMPGKMQHKKPITDIVVAHGLEYAATATPYYWKDLLTKVRKGLEVEGPAFLHIFAPCPRGWRSDAAKTIDYTKLAVETCVFPVYEVVNGKYELSTPSKLIALAPQKKKPITDYLKGQGRYRHLFNPKNQHVIDELQRFTDERWAKLLKKVEQTA